jgi:hypothetical protein
MSENEIIPTAPVSEGTPADASVDPVASIPAGTSDEGDGTTPVNPDEYTKIDPTKLSKSELKFYKKFQGDFTKARQQDKVKLSEMEKQINSYAPLLSDPDVKAIAYFRQYGVFPQGYQGIRAPQPKPEENVINPEDIIDPIQKQMYIENQAMKEKLNSLTQSNEQTQVTGAEQKIKTFYDGLKDPAKQAIMKEHFQEMGEIADALVRKGVKVDDALKRAYNAVAADKLYDLGKQEAYSKMKAKVLTPKPEIGVNAVPAEKPVKGLDNIIRNNMAKMGRA